MLIQGRRDGGSPQPFPNLQIFVAPAPFFKNFLPPFLLFYELSHQTFHTLENPQSGPLSLSRYRDAAVTLTEKRIWHVFSPINVCEFGRKKISKKEEKKNLSLSVFDFL